jgi:hypothetical protein
MTEYGPVVLCTRCECTRVFSKMPLEDMIHIHMVLDPEDKTQTEIRTFVRTDQTIDGHQLYMEKHP